jgi:CheY-like chemotaxis protein
MPEFLESRADLPQAIEHAVAEASGLAGDRPVTVVAEYPAHLPAVRADRSQVITMIAGMVAQVVAISEQGEVKVSAEIRAADTEGEEENPWAVVKVNLPASELASQHALDLAMAMEAEVVEQEDSLASLAAVRATAEAYGGALWLEKAEGPQPQLLLSLPLLAAQRGEGDLRSIVESHLTQDQAATETLLLLIDDDVRLEEMSGELSEAGYRVVSTSDGGEVLALARDEAPDLILLDMLSRDPGALDVAMVLKQDHRTVSIPVLFLTSMGDPTGERLGAASFLVRPSGTAALISTIQAVLGAGVSPSGRVLVIEDNDVTRETLVMMIQGYGYRVTEAAGAEEGLALAEHIPPELVLVNARMAQERDYWLLRGLRQLSQPFDIFVLADVLSEAEGRAAVNRGASGFSETGQLPQLLDEVRRKKEGN